MESEETRRIIHIHQETRRTQRDIQRRIFRNIFEGKYERVYFEHVLNPGFQIIVTFCTIF